MFSPQDIVEIQNETFLSTSKIWDSWSKDPIKAAVTKASFPANPGWTLLHSLVIWLGPCVKVTRCVFIIGRGWSLSLNRSKNASRLFGLLKSLKKYPEIWRPRMRGFEEKNRSVGYNIQRSQNHLSLECPLAASS